MDDLEDVDLLVELDFCGLRAKSECLLRPFVEDMKESVVDVLKEHELCWVHVMKANPATTATLRFEDLTIRSIISWSLYSGQNVLVCLVFPLLCTQLVSTGSYYGSWYFAFLDLLKIENETECGEIQLLSFVASVLRLFPVSADARMGV